MKKAVMIVVAMAALLGASPAQAHLVYKAKGETKQALLKAQTQNLKRAVYLCRKGGGEMREWGCWAGSFVIRPNGQGWLRRERNETKVALAPKIVTNGAFPLPACTVELVNREGGMQAVVWNRQGSGAYGAPQALPGSKMASAGSDWRTNLWTQLRWMVGYVQKYGGMCAALAFQKANGYY